jgi:hypothetical protein
MGRLSQRSIIVDGLHVRQGDVRALGDVRA